MKKIIFIIFCCVISSATVAQSSELPEIYDVQIQCDSAKYILVPTRNYYTFLKLDTSTGQIKQVHFSISEDGYNGELTLNGSPLVNDEDRVNGRFQLYPTKNFYNFLLLDRIDGRIWQVQWNNEENNRGIIRLNRYSL